MTTSRLSVAISSNGTGAKAILADAGLVGSPGLPVGLSDIDTTQNLIPALGVDGDGIGIQAFYSDLVTNECRYFITAQTTSGFFAIDEVSGILTITQSASGLSGQTKTVTVQAVDQTTASAISETYTITFTA